MKKIGIMAVIIVLSGALVSPCFAEITPGRFSVSPFIGWYDFDNDMHLKDKPVYGLRLGYDFTERWGGEAAFDYVKTEFDQGSGESVKVYGYRLDALYHFMPAERLVPFLAAGVGGTRGKNTDEKTENDFLFDYGAGVKYFLSEDWALRADIRHLLVFDGGRQDWEYTVGLTFLFGGKKPAPTPVAAIDSDGDGVPDDLDKCPDTPKGVKVDKDGCPIDSDGDGVPDYLDKCPDTPKGVKVDKDGCPIDSDGDGVPDYLDKCPDTPKGEKVDKDGCPIPEKVVEKAPKKVSIALEIEFDSGKAVIKPQYQDQIKKVADFMTTYPETTAVIEGHTDNVGKESSNVNLSKRRAESVRTYLIDKFGIAAGRLSAKGFGSSQPVADNATPEGRQKNRRINAVIETMTRQ